MVDARSSRIVKEFKLSPLHFICRLKGTIPIRGSYLCFVVGPPDLLS